MYCKSLDECYEQINAYFDSRRTGLPLIVDTDNFDDYQEIMQRLNADGSKQFICASEHTYDNGIPDIQIIKEIISGVGSYVAAGISQSLMLQGERALDEQLDALLGLPIKGYALVLVNHCRVYLEKYHQRDSRMMNRLIFVEGDKTPLPQLCLTDSQETVIGTHFDDGVGGLISHLERITDSEISNGSRITVVTSFSPAFFSNSMYAVSQSGGVFDAIAERYSDLANAATVEYGSAKQWTWLLKELEKCNSFSRFISSRFGHASALATRLGEVIEAGDENGLWALWLAFKVYGGQSNQYLNFVISKSKCSADFEEHLYRDLLDVDIGNPLFDQYYSERKQIITRLPENLPQVSAYCKLVGRHGKKAVYYLTDLSENEEYVLMQLLDQYDWADDELLRVIEHGFPELALYMRDFVFDEVNTKVAEKDKVFRDVLTGYFKRYKIQKICNHIDADFLSTVNQYAVERPFLKLRARSTVLSTMDRKEAQGYFFDALGVEYLSYIQAKCEQYGLIYEIDVAHCEVPSITTNNKDFKHFFPDTKDISDLDELKHHSQIYDYRSCPYPIHVFRELEIVDNELRKIRAQLIQSNIGKAIVFADHGASRLAVIYQHENDSKLELEEKGIHSGRCCRVDEDPHISAAYYDDGYVSLGNYERFKGGRKANLEVHGGASIEEVVIPIITISLRPDNVEFFFVDPVIKYKIGQPCEIVLFSNAPMNQPRLLIEEIFYDGVFQKDKNHALFVMPELKKTREYKATVYDGNKNTSVELSFRIERNTKTRDLLGL